MSIVLQGSTSGSVTLQEPAVAGTTVLTLPAVTGTILTTTSPKAGNVIQVVQGTYSTETTTTSNAPTFVDTGLTASITPTSSSSKILVIAQIASPAKNGDNTSIYMRLRRDSTTILDVGKGWIAYDNTTGSNGMAGCPLNYLDSPATTSSTTYKVQFCSENFGTVRAQGSNTTSTIILMEIAA